MILKYYLFMEGIDHKDVLWKRLDIDYNTFGDDIVAKDIRIISKSEIDKINSFIKNIYIKTSVMDGKPYIDSILKKSTILIRNHNFDTRIYADNDDYYYISVSRDYHSPIFWKADTFNGLINLLDREIFKGYKRIDHDIENLRKEIMKYIRKADNKISLNNSN